MTIYICFSCDLGGKYHVKVMFGGTSRITFFNSNFLRSGDCIMLYFSYDLHDVEVDTWKVSVQILSIKLTLSLPRIGWFDADESYQALALVLCPVLRW